MSVPPPPPPPPRQSERLDTRRVVEARESSQPASISIERRYEALIAYVQSLATYRRNLEQNFIIPGMVPDDQDNRDIRAETESTGIVRLLRQNPAEVADRIIGHLSGNDQIMLALASRAFAQIGLSSNTARHSNISYYELTPRNVQLSRLPDSQNPFFHLSDTFYLDPTANNNEIATMQRTELNDRVEEYMGNDHGYCHQCLKFRSLDENWWIGLMEYEYPELDLDSSARRILSQECQQWASRANDPTRPWNVCPAHAILRENENGQRTILTRRS